METPKEVLYLSLECTCEGIGIFKWKQLMEGATRADVYKINRLVKRHLPELYIHLSLNIYNPYHYYKTKKHLILVHSSIEYFLKYKL